MSDKTFLKLYRSMLKWGWYDDPATKSVFLHLLLNANWEDGEYHGVKLVAGDVIFGRKKYAKELGLSERNVRTAISHLLETGEISTVKTTNKFSVFHVEKWGLYQCREEVADQQSDQRPTNDRPTTDHIQEEKNKRININNNIYSPANEVATRVIAYLNDRCGTRYKATTKETLSLIKARLKDFEEADFYRVIDNMVRQWGNDPKMKDYLRPQTLFGTKFESYLNRTPTTGNVFADAVIRGDFK